MGCEVSKAKHQKGLLICNSLENVVSNAESEETETSDIDKTNKSWLI